MVMQKKSVHDIPVGRTWFQNQNNLDISGWQNWLTLEPSDSQVPSSTALQLEDLEHLKKGHI